MNAIQPLMDEAVAITIAATSASVALPGAYSTFRLYNGATETVYLNIGSGSATATLSATGNMALPSGAIEVLTLQDSQARNLYLAAIGTGATGTLNITPCTGGV